MENSFAKATQSVLQSKPFFCFALQSGVVNYSSLAKLLQPEVEKVLNRRHLY